VVRWLTASPKKNAIAGTLVMVGPEKEKRRVRVILVGQVFE
jgi:ribosome-associated protein YbcJ (S4-like RNA binding protein)